MHLVELAGRQRETETHRLALVTLRRMRARGGIELSMYRRWRRTHLAWLRPDPPARAPRLGDGAGGNVTD